MNKGDVRLNNLLHGFFVTIGIICVLLAVVLRPFSEVVSNLLTSIGSTLIATSLLSYLYQKMGTEDIREQLKEIQRSSTVACKSSGIGVADIWAARRDIHNDMWNEFTKDARQEVWLYGVAEYGFAQDEKFHQIVADGTARGCNYKILLLDPDSPAAKYWDELEDKTKVSKVHAANKGFQQLIKQNRGKSGKVELRVFNDAPSLSIVRADGEMLVTLYMSTLRGDASPTIRIQNVPCGLFERYIQQFERVWNTAKVVATS